MHLSLLQEEILIGNRFVHLLGGERKIPVGQVRDMWSKLAWSNWSDVVWSDATLVDR